MNASSVKWVKLGDYIEQCDERNSEGEYALDDVRGISTDKKFIATKANMDGVSLTSYKVVNPQEFAYVADTSRRGDKIALALNTAESSVLISSIYTTFRSKDIDILLPDYLFLILSRSEFDRYSRFNSWGSARETFDWSEFCRIEIPLPSIEVQQELVDTYNGLKALAEQNEALIEPLSKACEAFIVDCKKKYPEVELGKYIEECVEKNSKKLFDENDAQGINTNKEFQESKRISEDVSSYKIVKKNYIAFNANIKLTTNTEKFAVALYKNDSPCIISGFYEIMKCKEDFLIPEFLILWITRDSFAKYVKFMSCSSVRDRFSFKEMQEVKIPLPPIDVQQSIVNLYNCLEEAKKIASEAREKLKTLCPALVQRAANS